MLFLRCGNDQGLELYPNTNLATFSTYVYTSRWTSSLIFSCIPLKGVSTPIAKFASVVFEWKNFMPVFGLSFPKVILPVVEANPGLGFVLYKGKIPSFDTAS